MRAIWHLDKLARLAAERGLDGLLLSRPSNIFYATGFKGGSRLFVRPDSRATIMVGGVDLTAAEEHFSGTEVSVRHIRLGEKLDEVTLGLLRDEGARRIGFDELPVRTYKRLLRELGRDGLLDMSEGIWDLRKTKDREELKRIRKACEIAVRGMEVASELVEEGRTELEIVGEVELAMRKAGSEEHPFNIIVASGPNSALPHARASARALRKGDLVVVDLGATSGGYVSDMTRTFVVGESSAWQEKVHEAVRNAQAKAIGAVRAGLRASEADDIARSAVEEAGYAPYFVHGLGHGLGIEVHEPPRLAPGFKEELRPGYTVTIEPGIYLPGRGGVRIEDTVLVLEDGCEVLTEFPRELRPA